VFLGSIPPLEETPCSSRYFQLTSEDKTDQPAANKDDDQSLARKLLNHTKNNQEALQQARTLDLRKDDVRIREQRGK
jgi:hypothetical protein